MDLSRGATLLRADATSIPLADESVDLIVTSPPYFALRSYMDGGEHYDGQIGSEATPQAFLEALWTVTAECRRVLKPSGSMWVNLGDKYAGSGSHNNSNIGAKRERAPSSYNKRVAGWAAARRERAPSSYNKASDVPNKSLMGLPWRYAIGCIDDLDLILRAEIVWSKPNGLPESVTDRVRRSHEQWFHFTKEPRYYAAVDEIREPHVTDPLAWPTWDERKANGEPMRAGLAGAAAVGNFGMAGNPLGKLPGSVWDIPSEPLKVPDHLGVDHFAAFPQEWPRRIILGWSPPGICVECGEGRRPVVDVEYVPAARRGGDGSIKRNRPVRSDLANPKAHDTSTMDKKIMDRHTTITGYACACPTADAPTRPAVVLDPFAGTGTTVMVARGIGRYGIGLDLSADYLRLANWRVFESGHFEKKQEKREKDAEKQAKITELRKRVKLLEATNQALRQAVPARGKPRRLD